MMNAILDALLKFLAAYLPPPLYSMLINLLSHSFAIATSITRLGDLLLSNNSTDWNVQSFLPAIISILAAYFALASLYRTTSWVLRTSFWFIKWGAIISILMAGASHFMGNDAIVGNRGIIPDISRYMMNMANGDQNSPQGRKQKPGRPKAWESFERHREWQYQEANNGQVEGKHLMTILADAAEHVLESEWWAAVKNMRGSNEEGKSSKNMKSSKPSSRSR